MSSKSKYYLLQQTFLLLLVSTITAASEQLKISILEIRMGKESICPKAPQQEDQESGTDVYAIYWNKIQVKSTPLWWRNL